MSDSNQPVYDPRYLDGVRRFNQRLFFAAHEVWEDLWRDDRGPSRRFYQGLIQVAVCLHHFGHGNTRGARKLFHTSRELLDGYRPRHLGVDVERLLADLERCCAAIVASPEVTPRERLQPELIPVLEFEPSADAARRTDFSPLPLGAIPVASPPDPARDLEAADVAVRRRAAQVLAQHPQPAAALGLVRACADPDGEVRRWAAAALEDLGPPPDTDTPGLIALLGHSSGDACYWAATLLGRLGPAAAPAGSSLADLLANAAELAVRQQAAWALARIGPAAACAESALRRAAADSDPRLSRLAQQALQRIAGG